MFTRLSTSELFRQGVGAILDGQADVGKTSLQISTGKRILSPSDDPSGSVQTLQLSSALALNSQFQRNIDIVTQKQGYEEINLTSAVDNLQRVRELVIQGSNDSQTAETRSYIAKEISQRLDEMFSLANSKDANGEYIFAGFRSGTQPFISDAAGNVSYQGDDGQRMLQISPVRQIPISDPGSDVFMDILNGNGTFTTAADLNNAGNAIIYGGEVVDPATWQLGNPPFAIDFTEVPAGSGQFEFTITDSATVPVTTGPFPYQSGSDITFQGIQVNIEGTPADGDNFTVAASTNQSVFASYQQIINALESNSADPAIRAQMHSVLDQSLKNLDNALVNVDRIRSRIGARMNALDGQSEITQSADLQLRTVKSEIEDLDYAEAISRFQQQLTGLEAAQKTYVQIQGLSLFDYIR